MFGAYQAGVWAELSRHWQPDLVVGASIGSLNAWMIACGVQQEEILRHWRSLESLRRHKLRLPLPPWRGLVEAGHMRELIQEIHKSGRPSLPIGVVTTKWAGMRIQLHCNEQIGWEHLAASCAVPFLLPQQRIGKRWHTDGGLLSAVPLWAASRMGATEIVTVNVLPKLPWIVRMPMKIAARASRNNTNTKGKLNVIRIRPEPDLGTWRESCFWEQGRVERYIERGRRDAERILGQLTTDSRPQSAHAGR